MVSTEDGTAEGSMYELDASVSGSLALWAGGPEHSLFAPPVLSELAL